MTRKKADENADCFIVNSALALAPTHPSVVIICDDIGLFVILMGIFTFHNIQNWLGNKKRSEDWGWERTISGLQLVKTLKPPVPDSILSKISNKGKKGCSGNCSCRKATLLPSVLCFHYWDNYNNRMIQEINSDEDDDDEPILPDHLVEASLSLHVEEDSDDLPKDIGP
ncbi:hypothetical protein AVEN_68739-1 [Araneus ventricosus]|uniref:Uncharacterized protein n=1 Tax=Araneus ventricosus TaxID=182803 RepID=A0A4Y2C6K7_ARAVE|nr:hypothetical protein AVEN_68739-1 [Araneus ventricosus]